MNISNEGVSLIKKFEGCKLTAYLCPAQVWTIGYGWTHPVNGRPVGRGMKISSATAEQLLRRALVEFEGVVNRLVRVRVTQAQFDALVSLAYNIGSRQFSSSTLLKHLNAGRYELAAEEFLRFVYAGGQVVDGLVNRRKAEYALFVGA